MARYIATDMVLEWPLDDLMKSLCEQQPNLYKHSLTSNKVANPAIP